MSGHQGVPEPVNAVWMLRIFDWLTVPLVRTQNPRLNPVSATIRGPLIDAAAA